MSNEPHGLINRRLFVVGLVLIIAWAGYRQWPAPSMPVPDLVRVVNPLPTLMPTATPPLMVPTPMPIPVAAPPSIPVYDGGSTTNVNVNVNVCVGLCR
ncbi:MAG: hypothetical protein WCJ55_15390 [Chloroflexales bacterium]